MRRSLPALVLVFVAFVLSRPEPAIAQNSTGAPRGTVEDLSGARIASVTIEVWALGSALRRETVVDSRGEFRVDLPPPNSNRVIVNASGFAEARADVGVRAPAVALGISSVREQP